MLDAGAGELKYKKFCTHLDYVAQDFGKYDGKGDGKGLHKGRWDQTKLDIVSDIIAIPELDDSFDAIMCIEVFEHLPDPLLALKEFSRLLCKGGKLVLTAPFCSLTHFSPFHFSSGFNTYWHERHLPEYGLRIVKIEKSGNFFGYIAQEIRRLPFMVQKYSKRELTFIDKLLLFCFLIFLRKHTKYDNGSNEMLFYGCHVLAEKI
jgi:ubiquinone/menaquinone biosynthesis C-methylase UbiE